MSSTTLYRLSRTSLIFGGAVLVVGLIAGLLTNDAASTLAVATAFMRLAGVLFLLLGFPGTYAQYASHSGTAGLVGFVLTFLALGMNGAYELILAVVLPFLATHGLGGGHGPTSGFVFLLLAKVFILCGGILLGQSIMRLARSVKWSGLLLIMGTVISVIVGTIIRPVGDIGTFILVVGLIWFAAGVNVELSPISSSVTPATA